MKIKSEKTMYSLKALILSIIILGSLSMLSSADQGVQDLNNSAKWESVIFVYNADEGIFSSVSDFAHKILSPKTYQCNLCKLTYGNIAMKREWKDFLSNIKIQKQFLHKNEFYKMYPDFSTVKLPSVFVVRQGKVKQIVTEDEINALHDLGSLKNLLVKKLSQ